MMVFFISLIVLVCSTIKKPLDIDCFISMIVLVCNTIKKPQRGEIFVEIYQ